MITQIDLTRGTAPTTPTAVDVALEASVTNERATSMIEASWHLAEAYTGRTYWPVTAAVAVATLEADGTVTWPRYPYPSAVTVDEWQGGAWASHTGHEYVPETGEVLNLTAGRYRITQTGTVTPDEPQPHVVEAVRNLALYQLIHSAARREFKTMTAGDSTLTREQLYGLFKGSGAGVLIASEVRW
ncbi:MAG: hypothetical protein GJ676_02435 [Rhodobacteraceae bacterium]|nr:hypothetical protein [Paracoccaceae bacterium]